MSFTNKAIKFNKMKIGCIIMVFGFVRVNTLQFQRTKSGDTWGNQTCRNGTYVVRQAGEVDCMERMEQADCNWNFDSPDPDLIGFIPNEPSNTIAFKVRLLKKNRPSINVTCANHTAGNIAVQNVNVNTPVWDTDIGNDIIRKTLTYQFNQTDGTVKIGFTKHWDGFLLKLFINCVDESGRNIAAYSTTRCVMVKYEGNVKYPISGLFPLQTTSSTFFTQATSKKIFGTETTITPAPTTSAASTTEATKALAPTPTDISTASNMATTRSLPLATTAAASPTNTAASTTEATKPTATTPADISAATSMATTQSPTTTAAAPPTNTAASTTEATKPTATTPTDMSVVTGFTTTPPSPTKTTAPPPTTTNTAASATETTKSLATTPTDTSAATSLSITPPSPTKTTAATKAPNVGSVGDNNKDEDTLVIVIAIVGGVVALLPIIIFLLLIWYKRKKTRKYKTGKSKQEMNGLSNPAYDADGDVLHSTRVFNEDQACEEVATYNDEMPEYAVVNKTTEASTNNGMIVIETKNPPDEQDIFSDAMNKQ